MTKKFSDYARQELERLNSSQHSSLVPAFDSAIDKFGDRTAFICAGQATSFAELARCSRLLAAWLKGRCGLRAGDRIAIQLPNLTQYPIATWAALLADLVIVNVNPLYTERELLHQFNDSGAKALIVWSDLLPLIDKVVPRTDIDWVVATSAIDMLNPQPLPDSALSNVVSLTDAIAAGAKRALPDSVATLDDTAVLQYTSGTTGVAKGAMLTHGNLYASARMGDETFGVDPKIADLAIAPMPLYHIYGFVVNVISGVLKGSSSVLIPNARDTDDLIRTMQKHPFTVFTGINTLFISMMQHPEFDAIDFSHLRRVISGGTAMVDEIATDWQNRTGTHILEGYGLSESSAGGTVNTPQQRQLGSVGKPLTGSEIRVVDEERTVLGSGQRGELQIRGPHVMLGYWQRPEATREVLDDDGWFSTGDVAIIQEDGFVRIVDRLKDMIIVSGFNVYPNEIENVVYGLEDVVECAAVGVPDARTGEAVKLYVVSQAPGLSQDDIRGYCRAQMAAYKVPKFIEFRDELPKSIVGKILRRELRESSNT